MRQTINNENYLVVVQGLLEMYSLTKAGQFEFPEADALRDAMDEPWARLTQAEKAKALELSEIVNTICERANIK